MSDQNTKSASPNWSTSTKMVVGITIIAVVAAFLVKFHSIIGPVILAFILAYILHPVVNWLIQHVKVPWKTAVNLIYLIFVIVVIVVVTISGLAIIQQLQSLVSFIQRSVKNLPALAAELSERAYYIGPVELDLSQFDLQALIEQLISVVQPMLGRAGSIISTFAASAAITLGWGFFVLVVSYFLLLDADRFQDEIVQVEIPGYTEDFHRLSRGLGRIWNAFLRGQLILIIFVILSYTVLMMGLGVRFALGIAILAGFSRFIPYVGPLILWIITGLVAMFQSGNYFGLEPLYYSLLVVALAFLLDQIFDNIITPRFLGQALGVHPAAVLVAAVIAAKLIGIIGLILAAPVLASINLGGRYTYRKLFDLEPWPEPEPVQSLVGFPWTKGIEILRNWWQRLKRRK